MEQTLGKYQIKEELGTGGFATVYLAENRMLGTAVALKILDPNMAKDEKFLTLSSPKPDKRPCSTILTLCGL